MTREEFFNELNSPTAAKWSCGIAFERAAALPIDFYSVFSSFDDAVTYAKGSKAYPGQIIAVLTETTNLDSTKTTTTASVYVIQTADATNPELIQLSQASTTTDLANKVGSDDITGLSILTDTDEAQRTITRALTLMDDLLEAHGIHINKKVDSVTAEDKSVTVTTKTTKDDAGYNVNAVTVKAARSAKTGNRLTLETDGLYVPPVPEQTDYSVTVGVAATTTEGMLKTYEVKQLNKVVGTIDIPKDFLVKSGSVKTVTEANKPYTGAKVGDKYIELIINSKDSTTSTGDTALYIPVKDLVDVYTGDAGSTTKVKVTVGSDNVITAELLDNAVTTGKIAANAVTTAKIADANVTEAKIATDAVTTNKIKDGNVTKAKLADPVSAVIDNSVSAVTLASGTNNGTVKLSVTKNDGKAATVTDNIVVKGINNAAYKDVATTVTAGAATLPTADAVAKYVDSALYVSRWTE